MSAGKSELVGLKRRLVLTGLGLRPGDVRDAIDAHPVRITSLLNGETGMRPQEVKRFARIVGRRTRELFG